MKGRSLLIGCAALALAGCNDNSQSVALIVQPQSAYGTVFAADIGHSVSEIYSLTLTNPNLYNSGGSQTFSITASLPPGFSISANTCEAIRLGQTCTMTLLFTPTASHDYFQSGTIVFNAGIATNHFAIQAVPATLMIPTEDDPNDSHKTDIEAAVAGGAPALTEVDTGSQLLVVAAAAVGPDIRMTNQEVTLDYGQGQTILHGYLGYGSVRFTTNTQQTLSTTSNTPIVVVPDIPQGDYQVIMGMDLHNQVSARLYLPYPYNEMFVLDHTGGTLTLGQLTESEISAYATYSLSPLPSSECANSNVITPMTNTCWDDEDINVNYDISLSGGGNTNIIYPTLFDSGASNASFQFPAPLSWMTLTGNIITNTIDPSFETSEGTTPIPLTSTVLYTDSDAEKVNLGNEIFSAFKVLYDQEDGLIGLRS